MPARTKKPCRSKGCRLLTRDASGYCEQHSDQARAWATRKGSGRGGRPWRRLRLRVLERDQYLCQPCLAADRVTQADEVDHIVAKAHGGTDDESNLRAICGPCHREKTARESRPRP